MVDHLGAGFDRATKLEWVVDMWPRGYAEPPDVMPLSEWIKED